MAWLQGPLSVFRLIITPRAAPRPPESDSAAAAEVGVAGVLVPDRVPSLIIPTLLRRSGIGQAANVAGARDPTRRIGSRAHIDALWAASVPRMNQSCLR
jgi:hypothetical protein